jgi:hypothetical protein
VDIADIAISRQTCEGEFSLSMLEPTSRVVQPKGRESKLVLRIIGLREV